MQREISAIPDAMCENVMENFKGQLQECVGVERLHFPGILFHK